MTNSEADLEEADVPELALVGLNEAHERAKNSGLPLVFVRNDQLIRIENGVVTVLKQMPPRKKVTIQIRRIG